jgi:hypothetical protein
LIEGFYQQYPYFALGYLLTAILWHPEDGTRITFHVRPAYINKLMKLGLFVSPEQMSDFF